MRKFTSHVFFLLVRNNLCTMWQLSVRKKNAINALRRKTADICDRDHLEMQLLQITIEKINASFSSTIEHHRLRQSYTHEISLSRMLFNTTVSRLLEILREHPRNVSSDENKSQKIFQVEPARNPLNQNLAHLSITPRIPREMDKISDCLVASTTLESTFSTDVNTQKTHVLRNGRPSERVESVPIDRHVVWFSRCVSRRRCPRRS